MSILDSPKYVGYAAFALAALNLGLAYYVTRCRPRKQKIYNNAVSILRKPLENAGIKVYRKTLRESLQLANIEKVKP